MASLKTAQPCGHAWAWHVEGACQKCRIAELEHHLAKINGIAMNDSEAQIKLIDYMAETVPDFRETLERDVPDWAQRLAEARRLNKMAKRR